MDAPTSRTANIRQWVADAGGQSRFSELGAGRWSPTQISQWVSTGSPKGIGHKLAREIESVYGKPPGSMDRPAIAMSQPVGLDTAKLDASMRFLQNLFQAGGKQFDPMSQSMLIAAVYAELLTTLEPNLVEMAYRYGKGLDDERQREAEGAGTDDRTGGAGSARTAKAAAGRKG